MNDQDQLYADCHSNVERFVFDHRVSTVFADMIRRSVPGYATTIAFTGLVAAEAATAPDARIYDLGCSLGASLISVGKQAHERCSIIGIDNADSMIQQCQQNVAELKQNITLECADITTTPIQQASAVILNYTLQFVAPKQRVELLSTIYQGLLPDGVLILSEKIVFEDAAQQSRMDDLHHAFKRRNGYSELEIANKRNALENVLIADSVATHIQRMKTAGFTSAEVCLQCLNFVTFIAVKT